MTHSACAATTRGSGSRRRFLQIGGAAALASALGACDVWSLASQPNTRDPGGSPFSINALRARTFGGSDIRLRRVIGRQSTYTTYLMTYTSDGLTITGVAEVPHGTGPFPVVILNHGYALPAQYETGAGTRAISTELASRGYLTLASDYRGMGGSEDDMLVNFGARLEFAIDVLNLVAAIPTLPEARRDVVGMWGHSLGCDIALRAAEVSSVVGPVSLWAPISAWMDDMAAYYRLPTTEESVRLRQTLSPGNYLSFLRGPVAIHQGEDDRVVRPAWAEKLHRALAAAGVPSTLSMHEGLGHFLDIAAQVVIEDTGEFFAQHLTPA